MEKRVIIGYKMKDDCKKYEDAACKICGFGVGRICSAINIDFQENSDCAKALESAGVLSLWFDPVFEAKFKVGDWAFPNFKSQIGAEKIIGFHQDGTLRLESRATNHCNPDDYRLATPSEIAEANKPKLPKIGGHQVSLNMNIVSCGCTSIFVNHVFELEKALKEVNAESITIKGEKVTMEQISQIVKAINQ